MHLHAVGVGRLLAAIALFDDLVLQAALGRLHTGLRLVGSEELLALGFAGFVFFLLGGHHIGLNARLCGGVVHDQSGGVALQCTDEDLCQDVDVGWPVREGFEVLAQAATDVHAKGVAHRIERRLQRRAALLCWLYSCLGHRATQQHGQADGCEGCQLVDLLHHFTISSSSTSNSSVELGLIGPALCAP